MLKLKRTKLMAVMIAVLLALPFASLSAMAENGLEGPGTTNQGTDALTPDGADGANVPGDQEPTNGSEGGEEKPTAPGNGTADATKSSGNNANDATPAVPATQEFTVSFINFDGEEFYNVKVGQGKLVEAPIFTPMLADHSFLGWRDVTSLIEDEWFDFHLTPVGGDLVIIAVYEGVASIIIEEEPEETEEGTTEAPNGGTEDEGSSENKLPHELSDGTTVIGKRDETLGGLEILIIDDEDDGTDNDKGSEEEGLSEFDDEEESVPLAGPTAPTSPLDGLQVQIFSNHSDCVQEGSTLSVWAELNNTDRISEMAFQWQSSADGVNWVNVEGANDLQYDFTASSETVNLSWRIGISAVPVVTAPSVVAENVVDPTV